MQIDERFLTVHPATAAWWERRSSCESCRHLRLKRGEGNEGVMRCAVAKHPDPQVRHMLVVRPGVDLRPYCIDARSEKGSCGPDAALWEENE